MTRNSTFFHVSAQPVVRYGARRPVNREVRNRLDGSIQGCLIFLVTDLTPLIYTIRVFNITISNQVKQYYQAFIFERVFFDGLYPQSPSCPPTSVYRFLSVRAAVTGRRLICQPQLPYCIQYLYRIATPNRLWLSVSSHCLYRRSLWRELVDNVLYSTSSSQYTSDQTSVRYVEGYTVHNVSL